MNLQGEYTDGPGRVLTVGARVIMANQNQAIPSGSPGKVLALPPGGTDWHGFPRVDFGQLGTHYVPDVSLRVDNRPTSTPVDWDNLAEWVAGLESSLRERLADALRAHGSADNEAQIVSGIRELLADEASERVAVAVVFRTTEFDNGFFVDTNGKVTFEDGSTGEFYFEAAIGDQLTDEYGVVAMDFALGVNLLTDEIVTDDHHENVLRSLGLKN